MPLYKTTAIRVGNKITNYGAWFGEKSLGEFKTEREADKCINDHFIRTNPKLEHVITNWDIIEGEFSGYI